MAVKIHEMTGKKVVRLLGRERDIRDKFAAKTQQVEAQFSDVVEQLGVEFGVGEEIKDEDARARNPARSSIWQTASSKTPITRGQVNPR